MSRSIKASSDCGNKSAQKDKSPLEFHFTNPKNFRKSTREEWAEGASMLLGIDAGGTYTDAVLFSEEEGVLKHSKSLTAKHDLSLGITAAVDKILLPDQGREIRMVSLSTTLATNAMVEAHSSPVCLILIGFKQSALERSRLGEAIGADPCVFIEGGHDSHGNQLVELDMKTLSEAIERYSPQVSSFAVGGIFSVRNPEHENRVRDYILKTTGQAITCAHELSSGLDAPRRALTAVLNARLVGQIHQLIGAVQGMLRTKRIDAPLMVVKGDGSLIASETAIKRPVETILSGPAASVIGAKFLAEEPSAFVSDIGGTTTDIAILEKGQPVLDSSGAVVGGWQTMVEAVAVRTYGLGGDSEANFDRESHGVKLGPRKVQPISLLAMEYPHVLETLEEQLDSHRILENDGRFALRLRKLDTQRDSLSRMERKLWDALEAGPMALNQLLERPAFSRPLDRLVDRGLVIRSGLCPSDASHILNKQSSWNRDAAIMAAKLYVRFAAEKGYFVPMTAEEFGRVIYEQTLVQSAETISDAALHDMGFTGFSKQEKLSNAVASLAFKRKKDQKPSLLDISLKLNKTLVAIGAPAKTYYPEIAERLNTGLVVPDYAEVANAVGAVAGGVIQNLKAIILSPERGRYRVHIATGPITAEHAATGIKEFSNLEEAAGYAVQTLEATVKELAKTCGASEVEVTTRRDDTLVEVSGEKTFIESKIVSTAQGRPDKRARAV